MAKPTITREHSLFKRASWNEKEKGIEEGNKEDYCMGRVDQDTSEKEPGSSKKVKSRECAKKNRKQATDSPC